MTIRTQASATIEASCQGFAPGLATVGVRVVDPVLAVDTVARFTAGVVEAPAGSGIYHAPVTVPGVNKKYGLVWDNGTISPTTVAVEDLVVGVESTSPSRVTLISAAGFDSGLSGSIGYRIIDPPTGILIQARSTTGISEYPAGSGIYWKQGTAPAATGSYASVWDGGTPTKYAIDTDPMLVAIFVAPPAGVLPDLTSTSLAPDSMYRGDTRYMEFEITHSDTGLPYDITGASLWFTAKQSIADADPGVFQCTIANGKVVLTNAAGGTGYARIDPADTSSLPDATISLEWDLQIKLPITDTPITTVGRGTLHVVTDVTESTT